MLSAVNSCWASFSLLSIQNCIQTPTYAGKLNSNSGMHLKFRKEYHYFVGSSQTEYKKDNVLQTAEIGRWLGFKKLVRGENKLSLWGFLVLNRALLLFFNLV